MKKYSIAGLLCVLVAVAVMAAVVEVPLAPAFTPAVQGVVGGGGTAASVAVCTSIEDSVTGTTDSTVTWAEGDVTQYQAQAFVADTSYSICKVDVYVQKIGSPTFTIKARVYTTTSSSPGAQTGADSDAVSVSTFPTTTSNWITFTFSGVKPSISTGTYFLALYTTNGPGDWSNYAGWDKEVTSTCMVGAKQCIQYSTNGSTWTEVDNRNMKYRIYKSE